MLLDWFTVACQAVNFLVLAFILHRFVFRPILAGARARQERIAAQLARAEQARAEAEEAREGLERQRAELSQARDRAMARADAEAARRLEAALAEVDARAEERGRQWEKALADQSEVLARDIRVLVGRQATHIARRALADMAGEGLEDRLALVLAERLDEVRPELDPALSLEAGRKNVLRVQVAEALSAETRQALLDALALAFPGVELRLETGPGPGLVLAAGDRRLEWTLDRYLLGLEDDINEALQRARQP